MNVFDFRLLSENEQMTLLYEHGVYIGKLKTKEHVAVLYQLDSFYVEIFYKKYRCFITGIDCFTSTEKLTPYLTQVNIEDLIRCAS